MERKTVVMVSLLAVLVVGFVGMVGIMKGNSGMTVLPRKQCMCDIAMYNYNGDLMGVQGYPLTVRTSEKLTDESCQTRCEIYYGSGIPKGIKSVLGRAM